jgi:hypothetical protein
MNITAATPTRTENPLRKGADKVLVLIYIVVLAYLGTQVVSGLYYLIFETYAPITSWWHHAVSNPNLRHDIRDVGEGLFGGLLPKAVVWDHYKKNYNFPPLTKLRAIWAGIRIPVYAIPGFFAGLFLVFLVHRYDTAGQYAFLHPHVGLHPSLWWKLERQLKTNWDKKVMGLLAALFFGRRPAKPVFDGLQLWFAEDMVVRAHHPRWYYPPGFRHRWDEVAQARIRNDDSAAHLATSRAHNHFYSLLLRSLLVAGVGLAVLGFYVLTFKATS